MILYEVFRCAPVLGSFHLGSGISVFSALGCTEVCGIRLQLFCMQGSLVQIGGDGYIQPKFHMAELLVYGPNLDHPLLSTQSFRNQFNLILAPDVVLDMRFQGVCPYDLHG